MSLLCCVSGLLMAVQGVAQGSLSGTVTDSESGETLVGVTVLIDELNLGTATDADGRFVFEDLAAGTYELEARYVGYNTVQQNVTIADGEQTTLNIELTQDLAMLDDVVVTALGLGADRRSLGYSIQSIQAENIAATRQLSVSDALSGQFSGVNVTSQAGVPGGATSVNIRGRASLLGNNEPLYIVDGIPISNAYNTTVVFSSVDNSNRAVDINPEDIESMTVLKGPAAAALYGIDAANGAIVIETKQGQGGTRPSTEVNISSRVGFTQVNQLYEIQSQYGPGSNGNLALTSPAHWGPHVSELSYDGNTSSNYHINGNPVLATDPSATGQSVEVYDNMDAFFDDGISTSNQFSVSTGTRDRNLYFSYGRSDENGFIPKTFFKRNSLRLNGDANLSERVRISARANYINSEGQRAGRGSNFTSVMIPLTRTAPIMDLTFGTSDPANDTFAYENPDGSARTHQGVSALEAGDNRGPDSPFWTINNNVYSDEVNRFIGNAMLSYDLSDWINASYRIGVDTYSDRRRHNFDLGSSGGDGRLGRLFEETYTVRNINSDFLLTFQQSVGTDWDFQLITGHNYRTDNQNRIYFSGRGFEQRGLFHISNVSQEPIVQHSTNPRERAAVFGNLNVNYRDIVYLDVTGRNEWSSTLPSDNNSFFYPAVSTAFVFSEAFGIPDDVLTFGQLRLSVANVGNDAPIFATNSYFVTSNPGMSYGNSFSFPFQGIVGTSASQTIGNPNIRPESNTTFEAGTDLRFLNDRLRFDFTYYFSSNKDQIFNAPIPASSGYNTYLINAGELQNKGFEIQLNVNPITTRTMRWDATFNFSRNQSEVISLADGVDQLDLGGVGGNINPRLVPGEAYGVFYGIGWQRDENGNRIINSDPESSLFGFPMATDELIKIGDPNPDFTLGIRNTFSYRNFRFTSLIDIRQGGDVWNGPEAVMRHNGQSAVTENRGETVVFDGVKQDGSPNDIEATINQAYYQNLEGYFNVNEPFVEDASWVRLRDVTLSYSLAPSLIQVLGLNSATVSLWGRNLLLFTGYSGIDPETNLYGPNQSIGIDYYNNPGGRSFGLELKLSL